MQVFTLIRLCFEVGAVREKLIEKNLCSRLEMLKRSYVLMIVLNLHAPQTKN